MAVDADTFYELKRKQFKAESSNARFTNNYINAVNYRIAEMDIGLNASSDTTKIADIQTDIGVDANLEFALSDGVDYFLIKFGHKSGDVSLREAKAAADDALSQARIHRDQDATAADTNNETFGDIDTVSTS